MRTESQSCQCHIHIVINHHWCQCQSWIYIVQSHEASLLRRSLGLYSNCCIPVAQVATCRHLWSAARHQLTIPRHRLNTTVVGHSLSLVRWRSTLCQIICETLLSAQQLLDNCWKHTFSLPISTFSALGVSHVMHYINLRYLLTYLLIR